MSFAAGQTDATAYVQLLDDGTGKPNNAVGLALDSPGGGAILGARHKTLLWRIENTPPAPPPPPPPATTEEVVWTATSGVLVSGNNLTKTDVKGWGNAGAISTRSIVSGDGYVEFTVSETNTARVIGLSNGDTNTDYTDIDFGAYPHTDGMLWVCEGGVVQGVFGSYATGDVIRVAVTAGVVRYSKNGAVFYTSTGTPTYPLLVDTALWHTGATIQGVMIHGGLM